MEFTLSVVIIVLLFFISAKLSEVITLLKKQIKVSENTDSTAPEKSSVGEYYGDKQTKKAKEIEVWLSEFILENNDEVYKESHATLLTLVSYALAARQQKITNKDIANILKQKGDIGQEGIIKYAGSIYYNDKVFNHYTDFLALDENYRQKVMVSLEAKLLSGDMPQISIYTHQLTAQ